MPALRIRGGSLGLFVYLLVPMVALASFVTVALIIAGSLLDDREAHVLMEQQGEIVLEGVLARVQERRRAEEVFVQLLAAERELAPALETADKVGLAQVLVPLRARLGLSSMVLYDRNGQEMLYLGSPVENRAAAPLVSAALSGLTQSAMSVNDDGLAVSASTPLKGSRGIQGAMLVGAILNREDLKEVTEKEGVELALFKNGRLVMVTTEQPDMVRLLSESGLGREGLGDFKRSLESLGFGAAATPIGDDGLLVALVSMREVEMAIRQRAILMTELSVTLSAILLVAGFRVGRNTVRHVKSVAIATGDMVRGNYSRRVARSQIKELDDLASAINELAQQLEVQLAELAHRAFHDTLTNLPNRALFTDRLAHALARAGRRKESVAVMFLDLDNFKFINDSLGHQTGDKLLVMIAERLQTCLRGEDTIARLSGDEFTILLEDLADVGGATHAADRILEKLRIPFAVDGTEIYMTASIGIAVNAPHQEQPADLLRCADIAMYRAKGNGKAHYEVYDPSMQARAIERLELETDLRRAIERGEFKVYYQPVVSLVTGEISEVEALVRWEHPRRGLLSPQEFIPLAEETGLILPIGKWVLEKACHQARKWQEQYPSAASLVISANLSARQFQHPMLAEEIAGILDSAGLAASSLELEITESTAMESCDESLRTLRALKDLGVMLAIDDFGTGYSSFSYLNRLPIDAIKIDRSFVERLGGEPRDEAIMNGIITLAKMLRLVTIAEGIETDEQLDRTQSMGCDMGQGYYFSRPLAADALEALLAAGPSWQLLHDVIPTEAS